MTLRRYAPLKPSKGTVWPIHVRMAAYARDQGCIGPFVGMPDQCVGPTELDHVRASGGMGMKSRSTLDNAAVLCGAHHRMKTESGRTWRPKLIAYIEANPLEHDHVEPVPGCLACYAVFG